MGIQETYKAIAKISASCGIDIKKMNMEFSLETLDPQIENTPNYSWLKNVKELSRYI